jgi:hypothetical protein
LHAFTAIHRSLAGGFSLIIVRTQLQLRALWGAYMRSSEGNRRKLPECSSRFPQAPGLPRESLFGGGWHDAMLSNGSQCAGHHGDYGHSAAALGAITLRVYIRSDDADN